MTARALNAIGAALCFAGASLSALGLLKASWAPVLSYAGLAVAIAGILVVIHAGNRR